MRFVARLLLSCIVVPMLLMPIAAAQDGGTTELTAPWLEDADFEIDGDVNEPGWSEAGSEQLTFSGVQDEDARQFSQAYVAHNGTHLMMALFVSSGDSMTIQLDPARSESPTAPFADALRISADGEVEDLQWDDENETWVADDGDCGTSADAAATSSKGGVQFEVAKPLEGDECDAFIGAGQDIGVRVTISDGDETYRWPEGSFGGDDAAREDSFSSQLADWGRITVEDRFGDTDQDVPGPEQRLPEEGDPRLETGREPGLDRNAPVPGQAEDGAAYDANERGTPGPGFVAMVLIALAGLGLVAALRVRE